MLQGHHRECFIGFEGCINPLGLQINIERTAQYKKQQIHQHQHHRKEHHVLLAFAQAFYRNILLHHFLVEPGHGNGNKGTSYYLLEKEIAGQPVFGLKHFGVAPLADALPQVAKRKIKLYIN